jgi:hypothetical protein
MRAQSGSTTSQGQGNAGGSDLGNRPALPQQSGSAACGSSQASTPRAAAGSASCDTQQACLSESKAILSSSGCVCLLLHIANMAQLPAGLKELMEAEVPQKVGVRWCRCPHIEISASDSADLPLMIHINMDHMPGRVRCTSGT